MFDRAISLALFSLVWVPFFTSYATSANFYLFWTTWTILVFSLPKLRLELTSTLIIRFLFYCLPSVLGFAFDMLLPDASTSIKAFGAQGLPAGQLLQKYRRLEFEIAGWSLLNVGLGIAMQALFEILATKLLGLSSLIKVSSVLPLPEEVFKKLIFGLMLRGILGYFIHRYLLHHRKSAYLRELHSKWYHSIPNPFPLTASYDHPLVYLVNKFIPTFLPAVILKFHLLIYLAYLAIVSLEEMLSHSGYVLPMPLVDGIARRMERHHAGQRKTNFGNWGVLDWLFGTS